MLKLQKKKILKNIAETQNKHLFDLNNKSLNAKVKKVELYLLLWPNKRAIQSLQHLKKHILKCMPIKFPPYAPKNNRPVFEDVERTEDQILATFAGSFMNRESIPMFLYSNYEALKYIYSQKKLNYWHEKWVSILQEYTFVLKHKAGIGNRVADALSREVYIRTSLAVQVIGFDPLCKDVSIIYTELLSGQRAQYLDFSIHDGYLFMGTCLCISLISSLEAAKDQGVSVGGYY